MVEADQPEPDGARRDVDPLSIGLVVFFVSLILLVGGLLIFQTL
jgi:hypothetical protein